MQAHTTGQEACMTDRFMNEAIRLSIEKMQDKEGGPFGAVIVRNGKIIARGWNRVTSQNDPTAHAEIVAIRQACRHLKDFRLEGCALYVNCEPCPMCLAAAYWAGISTIYYAATREDAAAIGFADDHVYRQINLPPAAREIKMIQTMRPEALPVFAAWDAMEDKIEY